MGFRLFISVYAAIMLALIAWLYGVIGPAPTPPQARIVQPGAAAPMAAKATAILFLGTSLTSRGDWIAALHLQLSDCALHPVIVTRLAKPGASSDWGARALAEYLSTAGHLRPDILVAEFSINDASLVRGVPLAASRQNHARIVALAQAGGTQVFLATMSPALGRKAWERPGLARYQGLYRDLAQSARIGLIDTDGDWRTLADAARNAALPDGLHPTDAAMRAVVLKTFFTALAPLICTR